MAWHSPSLEELNLNAGIDWWYTDKVRGLNTGPHNYPSKSKKSSDGKKVIELATLTLSDFENDESDGDIDFGISYILFQSCMSHW